MASWILIHSGLERPGRSQQYHDSYKLCNPYDDRVELSKYVLLPLVGKQLI